MHDALSARTRSLPLRLGMMAALLLSGCVNDAPRDPLGLDEGARFGHVVDGDLYTGPGSTDVTDGVYISGDWSEAAVSPSFSISTASGTTTARVRVMSDGKHLFISARTNKPLSGSNQDLFEVRLEKDGRVNVFGIRFGTPFDEHCDLDPDGYSVTSCGTDASNDTQGGRIGGGGGTTYEVRFPLSDDANGRDLAMPAGTVVNVQVRFSPANARTTTWPSATSWNRIKIGGESQEPANPDLTVYVNDASCEVSVAMRTDDDYRVQRAVPTGVVGRCVTTFTGVTAGSRPVVSALNAIFSERSQRFIWPAYNVPIGGIAAREGVVFIQSPADDFGTGNGGARLIPSNIYTAFENRMALDANGVIELTLLRNNTTNTIRCTVASTEFPVYVFAMYPLIASRVPPGFTNYDPATGPGADVVNSQTGDCTLEVAKDQDVVVEGQDEDGNTFSGSVSAGETMVTLTPDPDFFFKYYLFDSKGDNLKGKDDGVLAIFGTAWNSDRTAQGDDFLIKWEIYNVQDRGTAQILFEISELRDVSGNLIIPSIQAKVLASKQKGTVHLAEVTPSGYQVAVSGGINSASGNGYVVVRYVGVMQGIQSAKAWMRAGVADGYDYAPNLDPFGNIVRDLWTRTTNPGSSWEMSFP
jgi:hypothetical protein